MIDFKKNELLSVGWLVAATAFLTLFLELLIARFFMFYFGQAGSLFAIPYALIGIAIGGFTQRLLGGARFSFGFYLRRFAESSAAALILLFWLSNTLLPPADDFKLLLIKTLVFGTMFLAPFFLSGFLLAMIFAEYRNQIGRLYFADLVSGAVACFFVPLLFHLFDAQPIILIFLVIAFLAAAAVEFRRALFPLVTMAIVVGLTVSGVLFNETPNLNRLKTINPDQKTPVVEVKKRWNEYSRLSLFAYVNRHKKPFAYRLVQDDAVSNIYLKGYTPGARMKPDPLRYPESIPWAFGIKVKKVLVLFAGCGKDIINFDALSNGAAKITGVELNPAVKDFCLETPVLRSLRLKELYQKPNVNLVIAEGRNYLEQHRREKYDVVFIAASGSPIASLKQASSRKYLETTAAYRQYKSHLRRGGIILFGYQHGLYRLDTLKKIHTKNPDKPFSRSIAVGNSFLAYKPRGFTQAQLRGPLKNHLKNPKLYSYLPGSPRNSAQIAQMVESPIDEGNVMTDDRPFAYPVAWSSLTPAAWADLMNNKSNFITLDHQSRVLPVMFLLLFIGIAYGIHRRMEKGEHRLKKNQIAYFMVTGFAYMCIEMGLIGKYDLFLGNPLYSMALITAVFLLSNGLGSLAVERVSRRFSLEVLAGAAMATTLLTILTAETIIPHFIGLGLALKIPLVMGLIFPIGVMLGMFFPYYISLHKDDPTFNVSSAYGFSVLSSVLGGAYSLAVITNLGYRSLLIHSAVCYTLLGIGVVLSRLRSKRLAL